MRHRIKAGKGDNLCFIYRYNDKMTSGTGTMSQG